MLRRECLKLGLLSPLAAWLASDAAEASQFVPLRLGELVRSSSPIWIGVPLESHAEWLETPLGRIIVTHTRVGCERPVVPGAAAGAQELWVQTLGGTIGKVGQLVHGEARLSLGERCLVFLARAGERHVVSGMAQGHYPIDVAAGAERLKLGAPASALRGRPGTAAAWLADRALGEAVTRIRSEAS